MFDTIKQTLACLMLGCAGQDMQLGRTDMSRTQK